MAISHAALEVTIWSALSSHVVFNRVSVMIGRRTILCSVHMLLCYLFSVGCKWSGLNLASDVNLFTFDVLNDAITLSL